MKKLVIGVLLLFCLIPIVFGQYSEFTDVKVSSGKCEDDGSLKIVVENQNTKAAKTTDMTLIIESKSTGVKMIPQGTWSRTQIYKPMWDTEETVNQATFTSSIGTLNNSGDYIAILNYLGCKDPAQECKSEYTLTDCPGFKYSCENSKLKVKKCYNYDNKLNLIYFGLNEGQHEKLSPSDIIYSDINSDKIYWNHPNIPEITTVETQEDAYYASFTLDNGNKVKTIELSINKCKSFTKNQLFVNCREPTPCTSNSECENNEFCKEEISKCVPLTCNNCETLQNHKCQPKCKSSDVCKTARCDQGQCYFDDKPDCCHSNQDCDDNLVCTQDSCSNNECQNQKLICKATNDPCVVGNCKEPIGCEYTTDNNCNENLKKSQEAQIRSTLPENILEVNEIVEKDSKVKKQLKMNDILVFKLYEEDHSLKIDKVEDSKIVLTISSEPLTYKIGLLKSIIVDVDRDKNGDIGITLESTMDGVANLGFFKPTENGQISSPLSSQQAIPPYLIGVIFVVIVVLGGLMYTLMSRKKSKVSPLEIVTPTEKMPAPKGGDAISVSGFSLKYGKGIILDNVSFDVKRGELVCLLGPSGTGKSTVIESIVGRKTPDKGNIHILGEDIKKNKKIMDYVGFVPQGAEIYMNQTVEKNLLTSANKWGIEDAQKKVDKVLSDIGLSQRKDVEAKKLSGGQQKLLSLGMELIRDPELLVLDEPTTGLDPNTRNNIITIISQIVVQKHKTALFTTHFMDDAEECDNVIILADKKIAVQGSPAKLKKMLPGMGKVVSVVLDNITDDLLHKIQKISGVKEIIREGRSLKIISEEPNAVRIGQKIDELGGVVNKTEVVNASMKEVFVYFTGKPPEE